MPPSPREKKKGQMPLPTDPVHIAGAETITGRKTFAAHAYFGGGDPWYDVRAFGAIGDGTTDDTAAFTGALAAIPAAGGMLFVPPGMYRITSTLTLPSNVTLKGTWGGVVDNTTYAVLPGSTLKWGGSADGTILAIDGAQHVVVDGLHLFGDFVDGVTGIRIDATGPVATHDIVVRNVSITRVGGTAQTLATTAPGTGVQVGGAATTGRISRIRLERMHITQTSTCIRVAAEGALDGSVLTDLTLFYEVAGIHCVESGSFALERVSIATIVATSGETSGLLISGPHGAISVRNCVFETYGSSVTVAAYSGGPTGPLMLWGTAFAREVTVLQPGQAVVSVGNQYLSGSILLLGEGSTAVSDCDLFSTSGPLPVAPAAQSLQHGFIQAVHTAPLSSVRWRFETNVEGIVARFAAEGPNADPGISVANEGPGGGEWSLLTPGTGGVAPGAWALRDDDAGTVPVVIDAAAADGALSVFSDTPAVRFGHGIGLPVTPATTAGTLIGTVRIASNNGLPGSIPVYDAIT